MIPIRIKIIMLAFLALTLLALVLFREYDTEKVNLKSAQNSFNAMDKIIQHSKVVHALQKERGLSIALLSKKDDVIWDNLKSQRIQTNQQFESFKQSGLFKKDIYAPFLKKLSTKRKEVDTQNINWEGIKQFYTQQIDKNLLEMLTLLNTFEQNKISNQLNALIQLAYARENLGLLRATISRYYQKKSLDRNELLYINQYYFELQNRLKFFYFYVNEDELNRWKGEIQSSVFDSVYHQIDSILEKTPVKSEQSTNLWWKESTFIIDSMKSIEMEILKEIKSYLHNSIDESKSELIKQTVIAISILLIISFITILTVLRILKALSVLINSLRQVESNQDFGIRIKTKNNDEFGQLSLSINNLLTFTDTIIKEKDILASIDILTGVLNRRSFIHSADKEIARSRRYGSSLSLIFCDIDKFKLVNDTYGHAVGDDVLKAFASTLKSHIRKNDLLARWGGEEFVILSVESDLGQATLLAEKLRTKVMEIDASPVPEVTCSFGVAQFKEGETFEELCERADQGVYQAKNEGRNRVVPMK